MKRDKVSVLVLIIGALIAFTFVEKKNSTEITKSLLSFLPAESILIKKGEEMVRVNNEKLDKLNSVLLEIFDSRRIAIQRTGDEDLDWEMFDLELITQSSKARITLKLSNKLKVITVLADLESGGFVTRPLLEVGRYERIYNILVNID